MLDAPFPGDGVLTLPDGRRLGFEQHGARDGAPVFFFHGLGASRRSRHPDSSIAERAGVRVIAVDRPGIGTSQRRARRRLVEWPADVAALADALGLQRFAMLGYSGGGAHALACAAAMPERATSVGLASGVAPLAGADRGDYMTREWRTAAFVARRAPWIMWPVFAREGWQHRRDPQRYVRSGLPELTASDRRILARADVWRSYVDTTADAFVQGVAGYVDDALVLSRPWGFALADVRAPVFLWHGDADTIVGAGCARHLAQRLPDCHARYVPDAGHFLFLEVWEEMLRTLTRAQGRPSLSGFGHAPEAHERE